MNYSLNCELTEKPQLKVSATAPVMADKTQISNIFGVHAPRHTASKVMQSQVRLVHYSK